MVKVRILVGSLGVGKVMHKDRKVYSKGEIVDLTSEQIKAVYHSDIEILSEKVDRPSKSQKNDISEKVSEEKPPPVRNKGSNKVISL